MSIKDRLIGFGVYLFLERPVRGKSYGDLRGELDGAGRRILARLRGKAETPFHHRVLTHIIGIERWGQSRLRTLLGGPLLQDEYDGYRPARDVPWDELIGQFQATRAETLALVDALDAAGVAPAATAPHNDYGPLSALAWLRYLETHASREIIQVR